jgi:hypothetical protein
MNEMTYNVGDMLVGKGLLGETKKYMVTKVTPKMVFFNLVQGGKALANCCHRSKPDQDGQLRIDVSPYRSIYLKKV